MNRISLLSAQNKDRKRIYMHLIASATTHFEPHNEINDVTMTEIVDTNYILSVTTYLLSHTLKH